MIKSKFRLKAGTLLAGALLLTGCNKEYPSKEITNNAVRDLLIMTEDDSSPIKRHHVINDSDGNDLGIVFIKSIETDEFTGITCAKYNAFTSVNNGIKQVESSLREMCISAALNPN